MASYPFTVVDGIPGAPISATPGICYFCRSAPRQYHDERFPAYEPAIDLATVIEMEGAVYICATCTTEIAHLLGMEDTAKVDDIKKTNRKLGRQNQILTDKLASAVETIHLLTAVQPSAE